MQCEKQTLLSTTHLPPKRAWGGMRMGNAFGVGGIAVVSRTRRTTLRVAQWVPVQSVEMGCVKKTAKLTRELPLHIFLTCVLH